MITSPSFKFDGSDLAELTKRERFDTPIKGYVIAAEHILLGLDGVLIVSVGFKWDFGSGAIDTPDMVYASIAHDAFYCLMQGGDLPWSERKKVDKYFKSELKRAGMPWWRRQYVYWAVRLLYPVKRVFS